jgi:predicted TIM-barrel fold metal-dependent hydrolase
VKKYRIIDSHCHVYPDKIAERATAGTGGFYDMTPEMDGKISTLIEHVARAGIDHFIIQSVATAPRQVSGINRFIAEAARLSEGRFTGLGTLHPDSESLQAEFDEIISLGLKGVKLHPDIQGIAIDDARMQKIYSLCEGRLPMLIHTGDSRFDLSNPNRMLPVLKKYQDLTVVGAHFGGWSVWDEAEEKLRGYDNFFVDTSSSLYAMSPERAVELIRAYGVERVLFGTDYPMWAADKELATLMSMNFTEEEFRKILWDNAYNLFVK